MDLEDLSHNLLMVLPPKGLSWTHAEVGGYYVHISQRSIV